MWIMDSGRSGVRDQILVKEVRGSFSGVDDEKIKNSIFETKKGICSGKINI